VLAVLLAAFVGTEFLRSYLSNNATFAALVPAIVAEWIGGRMGVAWSDPREDAPSLNVMARRALTGAAAACALAAFVAGVLMVGCGVRLGTAPVALGELVVSAVVSTFVVVRHELLAHGLLLRALSPLPASRQVSVVVRVLGCAGLSYAFAVGTGSALRDALVMIPLGATTGLLWMHDRGAFLPVGFHATWTFMWGSVLRGSLLDLRPSEETFWTGRASLANGGVALFALALAAFGLAMALSRRAPTTALDKAGAERVD
jgi:hypothetical protein